MKKIVNQNSKSKLQNQNNKSKQQMSKNKGDKCLANTLKPVNSKRLTEEVSQCCRFALVNSSFCANHQNLNHLTVEQFRNNSKICRGCKKHQYFANMSDKSCITCFQRGAANREELRKDKKIYPACEICGFNGGQNRIFENYCNKHITDGKKKDIENRGMKWCKGIIRGCDNPELPIDYEFQQCESCRKKENEQDIDRIHRKLVSANKEIVNISTISEIVNVSTISGKENEKVILQTKTKIPIKLKSHGSILSITQNNASESVEKNNEQLSDVNVNKLVSSNNQINFDNVYIIDGKPQKMCSYPKHYVFHNLCEFLSKEGKKHYDEWINTHNDTIELNEIIDFLHKRNMIKKQCKEIRDQQKKADEQRHGRIRNYIEYENRPETKQMRLKWKQENIDKCRNYWQKYRQNKKEQNLSEYLAHNAKIMRLYREKHPEYFAKIYDDNKKNPNKKFNVYKTRANNKSIPFEISYEQCEKLFNGDCVYCGKPVMNDYLNGIDRLFNDDGYKYENCVSCCQMCNYMKKDLDPNVFISICRNILIHLNLIEGCQDMQFMFDEHSGSYAQYLFRANKIGLTFEITKDEFNQLCNGDCYLCGKKTHKPDHINGVDRLVNEEGYILSNCRSCCSTCNYMKKNYSYDAIICQMWAIYHNNNVINKDDELINRIETDGNNDVLLDKIKSNCMASIDLIVSDRNNDVLLDKIKSDSMTLMDWEDINFKILSDNCFEKCKPPSNLCKIYGRWKREKNSRLRCGIHKVDKTTIDYDQLDPTSMSIEDLLKYMPPSKMKNLYNKFKYELEKKQRKTNQTKVKTNDSDQVVWENINFSVLTDSELDLFKPPRKENAVYMAYMRERKKRSNDKNEKNEILG